MKYSKSSVPSKIFASRIKWALYLGQIFGVVPLSGIGNWHVDNKLRLRFRSFPALYTILLSTAAFANFVHYSRLSLLTSLAAIQDNAVGLPGKLSTFMYLSYTFSILFIHLYFLLTSRKLCALLQDWYRVTIDKVDKLVCSGEMSLECQSIFAAVVILVIAIIENMLYDIKMVQYQDSFAENASLPERYCRHTGGALATLFSCQHPIFTIVFTLMDKSCMLVWNFGDIFMIVLSRLSAQHLHILRLYINQISEMKGKGFFVKGKELQQTYLELHDVIGSAADYITPLLLVCYGRNIYHVIVTVSLIA
ncbi:unnamed protein product [Orchesella dallaii]|uniref:Gustatory receptor n=1 Tax=Orchesella dallaii TaxID=48710 RepID=A0ABP1RAR3_9HEXA